MQTQAELEEEMVVGGRERLLGMMRNNEEHGGAANNPYASAIMRRFVKPIADLVDTDISTPKPGRNKAHVTLLRGADPMTVSYLMVRSVINSAAMGDVSAHALLSEIGRQVFAELYLACFEQAEPALYYSVMRDIERRSSKDARYREVTFKLQAKRSGVAMPEWGVGSRIYVGAYLLGLAEQVGMVQTYRTKVRRNGKFIDELHVRLTDEIMELIGNIKDGIMDSCPMFFPCVERPRDWTSVDSGGWHTAHMIRQAPSCVPATRKFRDLLKHGDWEVPLKALNTLQSVGWQINRQILATVKNVAAHRYTDEICSSVQSPKPTRPSDIPEDVKREDLPPEMQERLSKWRREVTEWFTESKARATKFIRFQQAIRIAEKFEPYPEIYFVYFADFRGRMYAQTTGVSPQGSDMQKALLRFAVGKPLDSAEAIRWFKIAGANKYGYDKASLDDRVKWADLHEDRIMAAAADPVNNFDLWAGADNPLQYLAWCFEFHRWKQNPDVFRSHIPVGMDGSCNGLQNFSAMLRDEVGGKATNLVPARLPNDIYQDVANCTVTLLKEWQPPKGLEDEKAAARALRHADFRDKWLAHGISRTLVKRSVMTKPYGSTRFSCADFIVGDYLKAGLGRDEFGTAAFVKSEYGQAAQFLSTFVWEAISRVVIKADEAMEWLQKASSLIMKDGNEVIVWKAPSGFPVVQEYERVDSVRIVCRLAGKILLRSGIGTGEPDRNRHRNGIAPNMVHSVDASHMALVACSGADAGLSLAMIHDDFGCHAADAGRLYSIIRETFVKMHENSRPLDRLASAYGLPNPPADGALDLKQVLDSPYFFS